MSDKDFNSGDKVYYLYNAVDQFRTVDFVFNSGTRVRFTDGGWMPIKAVFRRDDAVCRHDLKIGEIAKIRGGIPFKIIAIDGDTAWIKFVRDGHYSTAKIDKIERVQPYKPKVGDIVGGLYPFRIVAIEGDTAWVVHNDRNDFKTISEIVAIHNSIG